MDSNGGGRNVPNAIQLSVCGAAAKVYDMLPGRELQRLQAAVSSRHAPEEQRNEEERGKVEAHIDAGRDGASG